MPKNMLPNGDFNAGTMGWNHYGLTLLSFDERAAIFESFDDLPSTAATGAEGALIAMLLNGYASESLSTPLVASAEGDEVRFGMRVWMGDGVTAKLRLSFYGADGEVIDSEESEAQHIDIEDGDVLRLDATAPEGTRMVEGILLPSPPASSEAEYDILLADLAFLHDLTAEEIAEEEIEAAHPTTQPAQTSRNGRLPWDRDPWKIKYTGTELAFGTLGTGFVFDTAPDYGSRSTSNEDAPLPHADGRTFGQDFVEGRTITFSIVVSANDEDEADAKLRQLDRVWRADAIRQIPGAVATLVSDRGRLVYGRPRRFATDDYWLPHGVSVVTADFETSDDNWYSEGEGSSTITFIPAAGGGLVAPLASPLSTTLSSDRSRAFLIRGDLPTWPVFEVKGPITNPVIEIVDTLKMEFRTTLRSDQTLVVDTRPFARSILRDGASIAGTLTRTSTRLSQAALEPGRYELVLRGLSGARTATATIRWREAYTTP